MAAPQRQAHVSAEVVEPTQSREEEKLRMHLRARENSHLNFECCFLEREIYCST